MLKKKALKLDNGDPLGRFKDQFINDENLIYLDGNSLGKLPKKTIAALSKNVENEWGQRLIRGWNENWVHLSYGIGEKIATLVDEIKSSGNHTVNFDASNLSSGIYLYSLQAGKLFEVRKMMLLK